MIKGKTYLSGPMHNIEAVEKMFKTEHLLKNMNINVINPADVVYGKTPYSHLPAEGLRHGLSALTEAENIILTPGWEDARGCIIEMFTASLTGTKMFTLNPAQLNQGNICLEKYEILSENLNETIAQILLTQNKKYELNQNK